MLDDAVRRMVPYGSWTTPFTSAVVVQAAVGLSDVRVGGDELMWSELRPNEGGRIQLVRYNAGGGARDLLQDGVSARTAVHEYGGGAWWTREGVVWFSDWADQRLYRLDASTGAKVALTPPAALPRGDRYADGDVSPDGRSFVCVREHHPPDGRGAPDVRNEVVRVAAHEPSTPEVVVTGPDFVSSPRWSDTGERLCWIEWDHPNMPWDGTRLIVRDLATGRDTLVAGGPAESVQDPSWQPDGSLVFISDRRGWWNLYRWLPDLPAVRPLVELDGDIGVAQWLLGRSRYAVLRDGRVLFACTRNGIDALAVMLQDGTVTDLNLPFSVVSCVRPAGAAAVAVLAGTPTAEQSVSLVALGDGAEVRSFSTPRPGRSPENEGIDSAYVSTPQPISFGSADGRTAHALLYAPTNPACAGPEHELPPLLVLSHGGPTGSASAVLNFGVQYWTSRGFAVVDVNYGGSTGFGRAYRELLNGAWGVVDVEDCIAAARWLVDQRFVAGDRLCIRGGSAGGFTTLAVLARGDTPFAAGGDYFGVADLGVLARETHKFESRYLETLVGPYPEAIDRYKQLSPIEHVESFSRPLIVFQGLEDEVVPPNQSEMIVSALRAKGVPVAYIAFEGEQHGFRRAQNIRRSLDAELSFYAQILGFDLPAEESIEPIEIQHAA
jgi:dipeptidyl aminopeptidase/acylaminoacyl peptidase